MLTKGGGGGGEADTNYQVPSIPKGARGPTVVHFFCLGSVIICGLYKWSLSDQAMVDAIAGEVGAEKLFPGALTRSWRPWEPYVAYVRVFMLELVCLTL
jgi:hypothetical protein